MIRYLTHNEIDFEKYDACIAGSLNGILYANSWYLDMVAPGWGVLVGGDYRAVMPLPVKRKYGIDYIYQPFFVQQLGVFSPERITQDMVVEFLGAIPDRFRYVDTSLNTFNQLAPDSHYDVIKRPNYELDLIGDYEQLRAGFSTNAIRNIKKAQQHAVFITRHGRPETIIQTFRQHRGKQLRAFSDKEFLTLKHLIYSGIHRGLVKIYTAYSGENNFCAGAVFFKSHNKVVFLFSGSNKVSRENGAMFMLVDAFIRDHAGQPLVLDFEGSSNQNLARFYRGFGSKECVFLQVEINRLPKIFKHILGVYRFIKKRYISVKM